MLASTLSTIRRAGFYDIWNFIRLYTLFKTLQPDIIHINNGGYPGAITCRIAAICALCARVPHVVFTVHNIARPQRGIVSRAVDYLVNRAVTIFTTPSHAARDALALQRGFDPRRIVPIPNTLSVNSAIATTQGRLRSEFNIPPNVIVVCAAGLLTLRKGYDVLIEAVRDQQHALRSKRVLIFVFGDGEERGTVTNLIQLYNLDDMIFFPGHRADLVQYLADADIFVMPSRADEDMPIVILEAMLLSKPIIASKVGGIPEEVTQDITGLLVEPDNSESLGAALLDLVCDEDARKRYGTAGNEKYNLEFNNTKVMNMFASLYHSLVIVYTP